MMTNNNYPWLSKSVLKAGFSILSCATILISGNHAAAEQSVKHTTLTASRPTASGKTKVRLRGGQMKTQLENGRMVLTGFNGAFAGGVVKMAGRIAPTGSGAQNADLVLTGVDLGQALNLAKNPTPGFLQGVKVSGVANAAWAGEDVLSIGKSMTGKFALTIGAGELNDPKLLAKLAEATGIADLKAVKFTSGAIEGNADAGHLELSKVELTGPDFKLLAQGSVDVRSDDLDLVFNVDVAQALAQKSSLYKLTNVLSLFKGKSTEVAKAETEAFVKLPEFALVGSLRKPEFKLGGKDVAAAPTVATPAPAVAAAAPPEAAPLASAKRTLASLLKK